MPIERKIIKSILFKIVLDTIDSQLILQFNKLNVDFFFFFERRRVVSL